MSTEGGAGIIAPGAEEAHTVSILVVEDEVLIRLFVTDSLRRAGFRVFEAAQADEALLVLRANKIDILVTDIRMPGRIDGVKLAALAREQWPEMKIIIASSHWPQFAPPKVIDAFVGKPYDYEKLLSRIRMVIKR
jgi:two-component system, response regulator PdtaR